MSEVKDDLNKDGSGEASSQAAGSGELSLDGLFAFKMGMSAVYGEHGVRIPVTVLKYEPMIVSQVKSKEKDGYSALQVAFVPKRASRTSLAEKGHVHKTGFENGARFLREMRLSGNQNEEVQVGQRVTIESLKKGDVVVVSARSRGRGFSGAVRRWSFAGGPASHGSGFHRKPGSVGNRTWPGRVIPGKRMAGHYGDELVTVKNLEVIEVLADEGVLLVRGAVPGARNSLVKIMKVK